MDMQRQPENKNLRRNDPAQMKFNLLFFSDTHLGFDYPSKPRKVKERRGNDFFANYEAVINYAIKNKVDAVLHGGDLFFRSKVHNSIVEKTFKALHILAEAGIPVFLVPGNHERSWIPQTLFDQHPLIRIFDQPCSFQLEKNHYKIQLSGFPNVRNGIRTQFPHLVKEINQKRANADARILCMHQSIEGAKVGPNDYTFKYDEDTISAKDLPDNYDLILSGHIHRHQVLNTDLKGKSLKTEVIYSGSTERTAFAEMDEKKGFILITLTIKENGIPAKIEWKFINLRTRPMFILELNVENIKGDKQLSDFIDFQLRQFPEKSQVKIKFSAKTTDTTKKKLMSMINKKNPRKLIISYRGQIFISKLPGT